MYFKVGGFFTLNYLEIFIEKKKIIYVFFYTQHI
uniref:Uncharacterized protein n=1 Tax=viral metagenome TaxID=1070528 RepID=A0A6C0H264_9ZZZZ